MATEGSTTVSTGTGDTAKWTSWVAALVGAWAIVSPFVLEGSIGAGQTMLVTVAGGLVILVFGAAAAYGIRATPVMPRTSSPEVSAWIVALAGLWLAVSAFVLDGAIGESPALWSTVGTGIVALVLGAFAGYQVHTRPG